MTRVSDSADGVPIILSREELSGISGRAEIPEAQITISLDRTVYFSAPDDAEVELPPGDYRIDPRTDGHLHVTSSDQRTRWVIRAQPTWHELKVLSALALSIPYEQDEQHIVVLLPGGAALHSIGSYGRMRTHPGLTVLTSQVIAEAVLKWMPPVRPGPPPFGRETFGRELLSLPGRLIWGSIEPGASPTGFGPMSTPPNWISATVATCYVPPRGSAGPAGPGTETGIPPFPPGSIVRRIPHPGYLSSTTPVTVKSSLSVAGRVVHLLVTSHVVTLGSGSILSMTWTDVYQIVPATNAPVTFQGVNVATGRVPSGPAPPASTWPVEVAKRLTDPNPAMGAALEFELRVQGITLETRMCRFNAMFPGNPAVFC